MGEDILDASKFFGLAKTVCNSCYDKQENAARERALVLLSRGV